MILKWIKLFERNWTIKIKTLKQSNVWFNESQNAQREKINYYNNIKLQWNKNNLNYSECKLEL